MRKHWIILLTIILTIILLLPCISTKAIYDDTDLSVSIPKDLNEIITNRSSEIGDTFSLDSAVTSYLSKNKIHGAALAIVRNDSLLYAKGYGESDEDTPMQANVLFRLASVSKLITAAGIMVLVDRGRLSLNDTVLGPHGILYRFEVSDPNYCKITVKDLLKHEAGFTTRGGDPLFSTREQMIKYGWTEVPDQEILVSTALKGRLPVRPGAEAHYSNLGFLLLSMIIEAKTGEKYADWMEKNVLIPAGCYNIHIAGNFIEDRLQNETHYWVQAVEDPADMFDNSGRKAVRCYGENDIPTLSGAGAWAASVPELARFVSSIDGGGIVQDIISMDSFLEMTKETEKNEYGLGWNDVTYEGEWTRTGSFAGTNAIIKHYPGGEFWIMIANTSTLRGARQSSYMGKLFEECRAYYADGLPEQNLFE